MAEKKKALIVINTHAGRTVIKKPIVEIIEQMSVGNLDITVKTTTGRGDATNIVKKCGTEHDVIICCGGDGTLNELLNGVMAIDKKVNIGYIPTGSTNDLASTIGIPSNIRAASDLILYGRTHSYDLGRLNDRYFTYIASFGAATNLSYSTPQKFKNIIGYPAYLINAFVVNLIPTLKSLRPLHAKIEYDGGIMEGDYYFGAVSNSTSVAGIIKYNKDEVKLNDGKFEVILVCKLINKLDAFRLFAKVLRNDFDGKTIMFFKTSKIKFTFSEPVPWTLDGEYGGDNPNVDIEVINKAIDIYSPGNKMFLPDI